mgnify:FL=1
MCGIVGYIGKEQAAPILLAGLKKLEYRGYDSAGLAVRDEATGGIDVVKAKGRLHVLEEKTNGGRSVPGSCGIGHTRWATHGEPSETNAHPHCTDDCSVVLVHNGIIENYQELREKLLKEGYRFHSETDTEAAVNLIDFYYKKTGNPLEGIAGAMLRIRGSYAFGILFRDFPDRLYAARKDSPLIVGKGKAGNLIASDVPAILDQTRSVYYLENMEIAELTEQELRFYNIDLEPQEKEASEITWEAAAAEKGGYAHFMIKEIHEQPRAVGDTIFAYLKEGESGMAIRLADAGLTDEFLSRVERIYIVACGSAYHVGVAGKYVIETLSGISVETDLASEFRYRNPRLMKNSLVVIISQSGETADSLAALRLAREQGVPVLSIVNVVGSSIARESDYVLYTYAGPEISVATTKAYSAQLAVVYLLAVQCAGVQGVLSKERYGELIRELLALPSQMETALENEERIQWFASKYINAKDIFLIGRGLDYAIGLEGSLKMKEISYIHSEAYAAGELKHGTISLIEEGTLVLGILTQPELYEKTISNLVETKSRGAYLMGITVNGNYGIEDTVDFAVYVPKTDPVFAASVAVIPLQLMGYYLSVLRGLDVDKPRNLAKSVTVE